MKAYTYLGSIYEARITSDDLRSCFYHPEAGNSGFWWKRAVKLAYGRTGSVNVATDVIATHILPFSVSLTGTVRTHCVFTVALGANVIYAFEMVPGTYRLQGVVYNYFTSNGRFFWGSSAGNVLDALPPEDNFHFFQDISRVFTNPEDVYTLRVEFYNSNYDSTNYAHLIPAQAWRLINSTYDLYNYYDETGALSHHETPALEIVDGSIMPSAAFLKSIFEYTPGTRTLAPLPCLPMFLYINEVYDSSGFFLQHPSAQSVRVLIYRCVPDGAGGYIATPVSASCFTEVTTTIKAAIASGVSNFAVKVRTHRQWHYIQTTPAGVATMQPSGVTTEVSIPYTSTVDAFSATYLNLTPNDAEYYPAFIPRYVKDSNGVMSAYRPGDIVYGLRTIKGRKTFGETTVAYESSRGQHMSVGSRLRLVQYHRAKEHAAWIREDIRSLYYPRTGVAQIYPTLSSGFLGENAYSALNTRPRVDSERLGPNARALLYAEDPARGAALDAMLARMLEDDSLNIVVCVSDASFCGLSILTITERVTSEGEPNIYTTVGTYVLKSGKKHPGVADDYVYVPPITIPLFAMMPYQGSGDVGVSACAFTNYTNDVGGVLQAAPLSGSSGYVNLSEGDTSYVSYYNDWGNSDRSSPTYVTIPNPTIGLNGLYAINPFLTGTTDGYLVEFFLVDATGTIISELRDRPVVAKYREQKNISIVAPPPRPNVGDGIYVLNRAGDIMMKPTDASFFPITTVTNNGVTSTGTLPGWAANFVDVFFKVTKTSDGFAPSVSTTKTTAGWSYTISPTASPSAAVSIDFFGS